MTINDTIDSHKAELAEFSQNLESCHEAIEQKNNEILLLKTSRVPSTSHNRVQRSAAPEERTHPAEPVAEKLILPGPFAARPFRAPVHPPPVTSTTVGDPSHRMNRSQKENS